jgi:phenylacetate-CoA ligase
MNVDTRWQLRISDERQPILEPGRLRLVVTRQSESDVMTLMAEAAAASEAMRDEIVASLRAVTKLGGHVDLAAPGSLPNDGKVIADERSA